MPKLLQEPPVLQRPYDPRELFDSEESGEGTENQVSGLFGSTFGSFFTRSVSSSEAGAQGSGSAAGTSSSLPYGEITMRGVGEKQAGEEEKLTATGETKPVETASDTQQGDSKRDEEKLGLGKGTAVPSYLAELGVGSDLTIDSAFSSLKSDEGKGEMGEGGGGPKTEVMAKKLPSIFGLGSSSL